MTAVIPGTISLSRPFDRHIPPDEAELAAAAFLSRYQGRTLDAYRYDLRAFFQWAATQGLEVLKATRPEIELYVRAMEERGLAATTIDRPLDRLRVLPLRPYRRPHRRQPGPGRPPAQGPSPRRPGPRPLRARRLPVHR